MQQSALHALLASTGVHGRLAPMRGVATGSAYQPDLAIEITIEKKRLTYYGERKSVADRATVLAQVKGRLDDFKKPSLLITSYLSAQMAEQPRNRTQLHRRRWRSS